MASSVVENFPYEMLPTTLPEEDQKINNISPLTSTQLIEAVSWIMNDIIESKCKAFADASEIPVKTIFHAKKKPQINVLDYLRRFFNYSKCGEEILICALIYLDRIGERLNGFCLDSFNVHKLLLISLTVACKFSNDRYFSNTFYANIGGISASEFNQLEEEFLVNYLEFAMYIKMETYKSYCSDISNYYRGKLLHQKGQ